MDTTYYYCKCSICFENDSEMEFINCGDQYCFPCLERYVEYWIREGSWGLLPAELTCPVCGTEMQEEDWMPYISGSTIELWNKFKIKRRESINNLIITRSCPICNHSQPLLGTKTSNYSDFLILSDRLMNFLDLNLKFDTWRSIFGLENAVNLIKEGDEFDRQDFIDSAQDSFEEFLNLLEKMKISGWFNPLQKDFIKLLLEFGRIFLKLIIEVFENNLIGLEEDEDVDNCRFILISLQLNFQSIFPFGHCEICELEFCLPCQSHDWFHFHLNNTGGTLCPYNTRLDGSKQCPRCFVSIEKEPEGCNEMHCNYCGMKFCWECGKKWSKDCGIYNCKQTATFQEINENVPRSEIAIANGRDPEIGVPNVRNLHINRRA